MNGSDFFSDQIPRGWRNAVALSFDILIERGMRDPFDLVRKVEHLAQEGARIYALRRDDNDLALVAKLFQQYRGAAVDYAAARCTIAGLTDLLAEHGQC